MVVVVLKPVVSATHAAQERGILAELGVCCVRLTNFNTFFRNVTLYNVFVLFPSSLFLFNNSVFRDYHLLGYFLNGYLLDSLNYQVLHSFLRSNYYPVMLFKNQLFFLFFLVRVPSLLFSRRSV